MAAKRYGSTSESPRPDPLQAVLLADSLPKKFRPITLERPKVLLPLVNKPMIDYPLQWLESAGVEQVFVFCSSHSRQIVTYLEQSRWSSKPNFSVIALVASKSSVSSAGDALRFIHQLNVIRGDFVLISGDTVSNMSLTKALQEHRDRRKEDNLAVMTMVIHQSFPFTFIGQSCLGTDELYMAIDSNTKQLLAYEDKADLLKWKSLKENLLADNLSISLRNDLQDSYIDICSPEVLCLFTNNFRYQHLHRHFVKGLLVDDNMGYKIFTHEIEGSYAARVDNFRSYDTISKGLVRDVSFLFAAHIECKPNSLGTYMASEMNKLRSAQIDPCSVIGKNTNLGNNTTILNSIIGEGCVIGSDVSIEGCYIWNNVTIEDGCKLREALLCDLVTLKSGAVLNPGVVLSFNVVIGQQFEVPAYSKVSLLKQPIKRDSEGEFKYADPYCAWSSPSHAASEVGAGGTGYIWSVCGGSFEEEWRHSVAPIPHDKIFELSQTVDWHFDSEHKFGEIDKKTNDFGKKLETIFLRAVHENVKEDDVISEVNSLRSAFKMDDCCGSTLFYAVMKMAFDTPHNSASELYANAATLIATWKNLIKHYVQSSLDGETDLIMELDHICYEFGEEMLLLYSQILHLLCEEGIIQEKTVLADVARKEKAKLRSKPKWLTSLKPRIPYPPPQYQVGFSKII